MTLSVERENSRFRVKWQENSIDWLPDTASSRKAVLVFLRFLDFYCALKCRNCLNDMQRSRATGIIGNQKDLDI